MKLDESYELDEQEQNNLLNNNENYSESENLSVPADEKEHPGDNLPSGVSIESASYIENNNLSDDDNNLSLSENNEEYTPKLFSEDQNFAQDEITENSDNHENKDSEQLFDQDTNEEEDFEIPAFLRKQSFNDQIFE